MGCKAHIGRDCRLHGRRGSKSQPLGRPFLYETRSPRIFSSWVVHVKWRKRICGYIATKFVKLIAHIDRRVHYVTHHFHEDEWNAEYDVAIVFKYGESDWHDWKVWNQYFKLWQKLKKFTDYNIDMDFNYLDEDGNMPQNIWRGIYWEKEPPKYYDDDEEIDDNN